MPSFTAKELTHYLKELKKTQDSLDQIMDFVDMVNKDNEKFEADLSVPAENIKSTSDTITSSIKEFNDIFNTELDKIPLDNNEVREATEKLLLYHGENMQVIIWAEQQKVNFEEDSYWWRYWTGIIENINQKNENI
ncbi:MAG: hypothetical protein GTO02_15585 [Candidatus Dadabacteria bacterium]|nr:hypothetical protein [Candidatus Dadabacteria bacterium]NIQ15758.1 hypothetical protein [Candidatus Dadabacteria bacterium]